MSEAQPARKPLTGESFDRSFTAVAQSQITQRILYEAYGSDYVEEVEPHSFITRPLLQCIAQELRVGPGQVFADLGCGRGGPGLWVARETGACLLGIDFSRVGIEHAAQRARLFGVGDRSTFLQRDIARTELPDASLDAAMSVDVWQMLPDKPRAAREIMRLLRPGGRFVFTTWSLKILRLPLYASQQMNEQSFRDAGGIIESCEVTPGWERRQRAFYEGLLKNEQELVVQLGQEVADGLLREARREVTHNAQKTHVLIMVRKASAQEGQRLH